MVEYATLFGRSDLRRRILERFFLDTEKEDHVRGLARELGTVASAVGRELDLLERAGVLRSRKLGSARVYEFAAGNRVAEAAKELFEATAGLDRILQEALGKVAGVDEAFIFGSFAEGGAGPSSDIDVLVVGRPRAMDLAEALAPVEERLG